MRLILVLFMAILLSISGNVVKIPNGSIMGSFNIVVRQVGDCPKVPETARKFKFSTRLSKISRTKIVYNSNVTMPETIDDSTSAVLKIDVLGNGGWRDNFFVISYKRTCTDGARYFPKFFSDVLRSMNLTKCPIVKGTHQIVNFVIDIRPNFPIFPYGQYRALTTFFTKQGVAFACYAVYIDVVPSQRKTNKNSD